MRLIPIIAVAGAFALAALLVGGGQMFKPSTALAQSPPNTPSSVSVTRADGALTASWNAVSGATSYHITYTSNNGASWSLAALNHPDSSITISNADNSKTYIVGVRARNEHGGSGWRNSPARRTLHPFSARHAVIGYHNTRRRYAHGELGCRLRRNQLPYHLHIEQWRKLESCRV